MVKDPGGTQTYFRPSLGFSQVFSCAVLLNGVGFAGFSGIGASTVDLVLETTIGFGAFLAIRE